MSPTAALLTLLLLIAVAFIVSGPLRATLGRAQEPTRGARRRRRAGSAHDAALEAAREAKYQEIREAELDWRMGKLSDPDYAAVNQALRAEAIEILDRIHARGTWRKSSGRGAPSRTPSGAEREQVAESEQVG